MNRPAFKPGLLSSPFIRALLILSASVTKLVTVPLALVVDVALTPVYLIGFTVLVLTF